jgi:hypothetical protein
MRKWWIGYGLLSCILIFFFWREYTISNISQPRIVVEENVVLFRATDGSIFGMGRIDSPRAKALSRGMTPFFSRGTIVSIWEIPVGSEINGHEFSVQRVSEHLARSISFGRAMWWIGDDFDEDEKSRVVASGVEFGSDWWGMTKNRLPEFLPLPSQGILYAGDRSPSAKTTALAQDKKIPLISASETGGFMIFFADDKWELRVRK